jgi:hypothetical protein
MRSDSGKKVMISRSVSFQSRNEKTKRNLIGFQMGADGKKGLSGNEVFLLLDRKI